MTTTRIQLRRDMAANWTSANPLLAVGEIGIETDTGRWKVGDGTTLWNALGYLPFAPQLIDQPVTGSAETQCTELAFDPQDFMSVIIEWQAAMKGGAAQGRHLITCGLDENGDPLAPDGESTSPLQSGFSLGNFFDPVLVDGLVVPVFACTTKADLVVQARVYAIPRPTELPDPGCTAPPSFTCEFDCQTLGTDCELGECVAWQFDNCPP